ncbi:hypothetical protein V4F39_22745 [Aquincola sp. MAHUQ-54]|uniref:Pyrrolidone-carboxylate peptidase n=1 Tax=Aquincola agrisoli TaxID=3119538 RepID=A0AAW9QAB5_9BURK
MSPNANVIRLSLTTIAAAAFLAACGGDSDSDDSPTTPPPPATVACGWDTAVALAYEERRLTTPLPFTGNNVATTDQTPLAERIVKDTGFDTFDPAFAARLCGADGKTTILNYEAAIAAVKEEGQALWRAAVDRVQGRRASPAGSVLPNSDDRMLYWTRVYMTKTLRQWKPSFEISAAQMTELQLQFERSSRGQYDINLPAGNAPSGAKYRRMLVSGFDVFTLGTPGTPNTGLRNGNPSGATALEMDGRQITLDDGSILHVEAYVLPVSYDPFNLGMQEDTIGPWFREGPQRVDASISISQGGANQFWLEQWNGRFHGPSAGNDGMIYCPVGNRLPSYVLPLGTVTAPDTAPVSIPGSGCDINPPKRWLGYESAASWIKDFPPQFTTASLPMVAMVTANTQKGIARPPGATSQGTEGFDVTWHTNYTYFPDCSLPATVSVPSNNVMNSMPDLSTVAAPDPAWCLSAGGGGNYLSNESAYRNTLLRDVFRLDIPAGHIHIPVMNNYYGGAVGGTRNDNAMTDGRFEAYRTAIVAQTKALLTVVGNSLIYR